MMPITMPQVPKTSDDREILKWRNGVKFSLNQLQAAISDLPVYADNTAALAGGLSKGNFYRTGDAVMVVH